MIDVDRHRADVMALVASSSVAQRPLAACAGLVLAGDVVAPISLPPFDNSAMDGYAVRAADTEGATVAIPVSLPVTDDIPAGKTHTSPLVSGTAQRIMTGAPLPDGADSVVMVEKTDGGTQRVELYAASVPGSYIRRAGDDIKAGSVALVRNTLLDPARIGLAAALGFVNLPVFAAPRVLVVSTGSELITPPAPLKPGQIYESNAIMLESALRIIGCDVDVIRLVVDDTDEFYRLVEPRLNSIDLLITSGGVSAGAYEVVKDSLIKRGVEFRKVAMQPGGPQGIGRWNGVPVISLPGNPVSALVSYEVFVRPAILASMKYSEVDRKVESVTLLDSAQSPLGKRQFRRGIYTCQSDTQPATVQLIGGPGSHLLSAYAQANCLVVIPEDVNTLDEGAKVDIMLLR